MLSQYSTIRMYVCNASIGGSVDLRHCHMKSKHNKNKGVLDGSPALFSLMDFDEFIYNVGSSFMKKM